MLGAQRWCSSWAVPSSSTDSTSGCTSYARFLDSGSICARSRSSTSSTLRLPWEPSRWATVRARSSASLLALGEDVDHAGATAVRLGAAEAQHVDVLAGDGADHVGAGHEDPALGAEDDDVGEGGTVRRPARGRAEHDRDLRDLARRLGHHVEDPAHRVQRQHALGQPGAAGVPEADDRRGVGHRPVVGVDDDAAADVAHRAAHHGGVGAERDDAGAVDGPDGGEHPGVVVGRDQLEGALVEQGAAAGGPGCAGPRRGAAWPAWPAPCRVLGVARGESGDHLRPIRRPRPRWRRRSRRSC